LENSASEVLDAYERLSEQDRLLLEDGIARILGRSIPFKMEELAQLHSEELETIRKIIQGIHLTRNYVPDIREAYRSMQGSELPSRVSFGRFEQDE
jgi:hypothetical protein